MTCIAAKNALRRKKQFEHTLEQTRGQIMTLESEIYSIEAANINKETLDAMKNASAAMKQIHGGLTIDKVDETMYVFALFFHHPASNRGYAYRGRDTGKLSASNTPSAKKSARPSHNLSATRRSTIRSWTRSLKNSCKNSWTRR